MFRELRLALSVRRNREKIYSTPEYWDSKAAQLQGHAVSMWANNNLNRLYHSDQMKVLSGWLPDLRGKTVLDLGCGTGRMSRWLADLGATVVGIDFSAKSIAIAVKDSQPGNPTYRVQSMFDLDDRDCYDVILSWGSIAMACRNEEELRQVMMKLRAALRTGGTVLLLEPLHKGFLRRVLAMDLEAFESVMRSAGFVIRAHKRMHFWPARLALAYVGLPNWLTVTVYQTGQFVMRIPGFRGMGDYTVIRASATEDGRVAPDVPR